MSDGQDVHHIKCDFDSNRVNHVTVKVLFSDYNSSKKTRIENDNI